MKDTLIIVNEYFDGQRAHRQCPYLIFCSEGRIVKIQQGGTIPEGYCADQVFRAPFAMPGLVEAHCHLFLEGGELDFKKRSDFLKTDFETMVEVGRGNLQKSLESGVTLIRDAGDIYGVNQFLRQETRRSKQITPSVRAAGRAIRKTKKYGSFMALEADTPENIEKIVRKLSFEADDLKVLLTGIIDFENGTMKGGLQFSLDEARLITSLAREMNMKTYVHCSGVEGLEIAVEAGFDSIEHGFFMNASILDRMAEKQIAWVPTFSPVDFQYQRPELAGWTPQTVEKLGGILENHYEHIALAHQKGVPIVSGSDAGSYGVIHGTALIDEMMALGKCGVPTDAILASATSTPRRLWATTPADITPGATADLILLEASPYDRLDNLYRVSSVIRNTQSWSKEMTSVARLDMVA